MAVTDPGSRLFHESWYRIAGLRLSLRANLRIHRQFYRGEKWHVLRDPFSNQFWRLRPAAYLFASRLDGRTTVEEVWHRILSESPDDAPGQGEIIELLSQLHQANMLHYRDAQDGTALFERQAKRKGRELRRNLLNILFLRIPLIDPDPLLKRLAPVGRILFSPWGAALWLFLVGWAVSIVAGKFEEVADQAQGILAPSNLVLLYLSGFAIKVVHEFGHGMAVRRQGGEVHAMGVTFMLLAPLPYVDASASWSFRERWRRALVACSGVLFEFFVAAIALVVWSRLGGGPMKAVAYNIFFVASVTTFLFNANPLMRFDGYYVLCDVLDMPNLHQKATEQLKHLWERHVFGLRSSLPAARDAREAWILAVFGVLSQVYKWALFGGILVAVSQHYLLLSLVMGALLLLGWAIVPLGKLVGYLASSPRLRPVRQRALAIVLGGTAAILVGGFMIPVPDTFKAPGILVARRAATVASGAPGRVVRMVAAEGSTLASGDTIAILENPEIQDEIARAEAAVRESRSRFALSVAERPDNMEAMSRTIAVQEAELARLVQDRASLVVRSPGRGTWTSPRGGELPGRWIPRGDSLGQVLDTSGWSFLAVVRQDDVERLFLSPARAASVRLHGRALRELLVDSLSAIPAEQTILPSAALGWYGGGEIELSSDASAPDRAAEPFYLLRARISATPDGIRRLHDLTGRLRIHAGWTPLLVQGWRRLRQATQKYYRL